eukprot:4387961-Amphidinium_carterae.1
MRLGELSSPEVDGVWAEVVVDLTTGPVKGRLFATLRLEPLDLAPFWPFSSIQNHGSFSYPKSVRGRVLCKVCRGRHDTKGSHVASVACALVAFA